jgi:hypothetical protein
MMMDSPLFFGIMISPHEEKDTSIIRQLCGKSTIQGSITGGFGQSQVLELAAGVKSWYNSYKYKPTGVWRGIYV